MLLRRHFQDVCVGIYIMPACAVLIPAAGNVFKRKGVGIQNRFQTTFNNGKQHHKLFQTATSCITDRVLQTQAEGIGFIVQAISGKIEAGGQPDLQTAIGDLCDKLPLSVHSGFG